MADCNKCIHLTVCGKLIYCSVNGAVVCDHYLESEQVTSDENKRWIPVSERLPEELKNVLAYTDVGSFAETAHWTGHRWEKTWDFEVLYGVTHWMPLPEPPKEDAK